MSTFLGKGQLLDLLTINPALENMRSAGVEVGQCVFSLDAKRSTSAWPKKLQIMQIVWGWSLHSPGAARTGTAYLLLHSWSLAHVKLILSGNCPVPTGGGGVPVCSVDGT